MNLLYIWEKFYNNMKRKIFFTVVFCVCGLLVGCHQSEEMEFVDVNLKMSVVASIEGSNNDVTSRYGGDNPNSVLFKSGDALGMAVNDGGFVQWNKDETGDGWSPVGNSVYWSDKSNEHSFIAFYPYVSNATAESVPMPDLSDQDGTMQSVAEKDFLVAKKTQTYGNNGTVTFTGNEAFSHVSSLVVLTLKGGGDLTSAIVNKISISGENLTTSSTFSFDGNYAVTLSDSEENILEITPDYAVSSNDKIFYFVLNASTVGLSEVTLTIDYTIDGTKFKAEKVGIHLTEEDMFLRGNQYAYTVTIVDNTLKISGHEIKPWVSGTSLGDIVINGEIVGGGQS